MAGFGLREPGGASDKAPKTGFSETRGRFRGVFKEKKMNRNLSLGLGILALALVPAFAQAPSAPTGKIHGHVTLVTGINAREGNISLSTDGGATSKYTFQVNAAGDFSGEAVPGTYTLVFRAPDTKPGQMVDEIKDVKVVVGQDTRADDDMTRKEFVDTLTPDQKKQLEEVRKHNDAAMQANKVISGINADLKQVTQDVHDADLARDAAKAALGATASRADLEAKENEIRTAKYTEIESLMLKDSAAKPDASILWAQLCKGQIGLKKWEDAEANCKKAVEVDQASKKQNVAVQSMAHAGLGEIYARNNKLDEAKAAFDQAAKDDPTQAFLSYKNESVIYSQVGNADGQVAAAEQAIAVDPNQALPYYLKAQGLIGKATVDAAGHYVFPAGCAEAYQKYLEVAPNGPYAAEVKAILAQSATKVETNYKAPKPAKK
jgi:tetratricopeptide (TPR) repeat protein